MSSDPLAAHVAHVRDFARPFLERGDACGWFEAFYRQHEGDEERVPWADRRGHVLLNEWLVERGPGHGARTLVVGCGLGEEAEHVAAAGFAVTAFDVSPTAIAWCRERFPGSPVDYRVADLLRPPAEWLRAFQLVVEVYTLQALPPEPRRRALEQLARLPAPGGSLLVVTRGREPEQHVEDLPWPLTRAELSALREHGLSQARFEDLSLEGERGGRFFRVEYRA